MSPWTAAAYISCEMQKYYSNFEGREQAIIDVDGSGPLMPFVASCERGKTFGDVLREMIYLCASLT